MISSPKDFKLGKNLYRKKDKGIIFCRFQVNYKDIRRSTGTMDLKNAQDAAWAIFCEASGLATTKKVALKRSTYSTIEEIGTLYMAEISKYSRCSASTAKSNLNAIKLMLKKVDLKNPRLDKIDSTMVLKWREIKYRERNKVYGVDQELDYNYSLNSSLAQAKAVFSKPALKLYKDHNLKIPSSISDFIETPLLAQMTCGFVPIPKAVDEKLIKATSLAFEPAEVIEKLDEEMKNIVPAKGVAVAVELARFCGLTRKEITDIRWEWFEEHNGILYLSIRNRIKTDTSPAWVSKGNKKNGDIQIKKERYLKWRIALEAEGKSTGYVFDFLTDTARCDFIRRDVSQWVRQFIPDRTKSLHELRKQAGSEVATIENSIYVAAKFLRDTVATTEKHYAALLNAPKAL